MANCHVPDKPKLPFPKKILLEQKYRHHLVHVHERKFLQQFLQGNNSFNCNAYLQQDPDSD